MTDPPAATDPATPARWPRRLAVLSWVGWLSAAFSVWAQYQLGVYDTVGWLWLLPAAAGAFAGGVVVLFGLRRAVVGPRRRTAMNWVVAGATPYLLAGLVVGYMYFMQASKVLPNTTVHKIGRTAAVTLFKEHARLRYPHRLESDRLVMYFGDGVADPAGDLAAMDAHLARMEAVLGRKQHSRIHWVRGGAMGMRAMSIHSVALGSEASPSGWFDRHELAHSFLYQFSDPGAEPPPLLLEGWAIAMDGRDQAPSCTARTARREIAAEHGTRECLRWVLAADRYHLGTHHANALAGFLADFLLRTFGPERYLAFYNGIHPDNLDAVCERCFGCDLTELERRFWADSAGTAFRERATAWLRAWAEMLEREQVPPDAADRQRMVLRLVRALTAEEAVELCQGKQPARLPGLAAEIGLSPDEAQKQLDHVASQFKLDGRRFEAAGQAD